MAKDRDNAFYNYVAPTKSVDASDAAEKARTKAMSKANAASRPQTFLEQVEGQIAKTQTSISNLENIQAQIGSVNPEALTKAKGETNAEFNARVTAAYKAQEQPTLTDEQVAQGYTVQFVRTGAGGKGEYRIIKPMSFGIGVSSGSSTASSSSSSSTASTISTTSSNITLVSTEKDEYGNIVGVYSDGTTKILVPSGNKYKSTVDEDAYSILENTFKDFGLEELVPEIKKFMEAGLGSNQAAVELRKTSAYITRFKGNETRRASGLNVLSEAEYLALEDSYSQTLRAYGLQNYFGIDRKIKTSAMADIIGNDISAVEFKDRIDTVVTRVNNADPTIKNTLNAFYNITDTDLVKYFLNPKENLPKLQEKVTSAEIGAAALGQGLITDVARATALAQLGVTKEKAQQGYEAISGVLPTTTKLGQIYGEEGINYTQTTAEEEVFKQLESAKRKRLKLAEKEIGSFGGTSGLARGALGTSKSSTF